MDARATSLDEFLSALLRGAAKILGCGSTNLILINEKTQEIRIRLGTMAASYPMVAELEGVLGHSLNAVTFPMKEAQDSLVYRAWRERTALETSSVIELVGSAFSRPMLGQIAQLIGEHRFICVPALSSTRNYGVLLFQKEGRHPFSRQQRELLLRYARRIGEILESDLTGKGQQLVAGLPGRGDLSLENQLLQLTLGEPAPAFFVDTELLITSCNDSTAQLLGHSPAELRQRPITSLFCEPRRIVEVLRQQSLDPTAPTSRERCLACRKDGSIAKVFVEALLLAGDQNQAVGFLVLVRPADAEENKGDPVVRQERLATMGEMAAQLAHEMRNPLVAIGATLEALQRDPTLADGHRQTLGSLLNEIVRMDMTLKDYLAARHDLSFTEVELASLVQEASRLLESASRRAGQQIRNRVPAELRVRADYDALKHVLFNLLLNALEASPPEGEITCSAAAAATHVSISVEDHGPGLAASPAECLQPFFTTKENGTGLGLTVCEKIIRAHGGVVELRSRREGGCCATITLPHPPGAWVPA